MSLVASTTDASGLKQLHFLLQSQTSDWFCDHPYTSAREVGPGTSQLAFRAFQNLLLTVSRAPFLERALRSPARKSRRVPEPSPFPLQDAHCGSSDLSNCSVCFVYFVFPVSSATSVSGKRYVPSFLRCSRLLHGQCSHDGSFSFKTDFLPESPQLSALTKNIHL